AGTAATDAVNQAQLDTVAATAACATRYFKADGEGNDSDAARIDGEGALAAGASANAHGDGAPALGRNSQALSNATTAVG
ncbi:hypothetical protein, partial [Stenotrophomonas sp. SrG]|uniref:hypothetical protein n=1 Tax=Stenotrophomonas sp. SrG TaxID=3414430 RepID=UPI003CEC5A26